MVAIRASFARPIRSKRARVMMCCPGPGLTEGMDPAIDRQETTQAGLLCGFGPVCVSASINKFPHGELGRDASSPRAADAVSSGDDY
jgi:hypothetical protein